MSGFGTFFRGHPGRVGAAFAAVAAFSFIGWYLGSPLFVRSYRNDPLPLASADSSASAAQTTAPTTATAAPTARVIASGELGFVDPIHNGKGPVRVVAVGDQRFVRFEDVMLTNAPDVHVYLSRETGGNWSEGTSLYLGPLKATNGSFNYELPAGADPAGFRSVVVWCRAFRVLITWADLT